MTQMETLFQDPAYPLTIDTTIDASAAPWAKLDDDQLELWLGDYLWFADFASPEHRANCGRTCDELIVECVLRGRHDLIRKAWTRMAGHTRRIQ